LDKPFVDSGKFVPTTATAKFYNVDTGLAFSEDDREKPDGLYKTVFGPVVCHAGLVYGASNHNLRLALTRLTKVREPEIVGLHNNLEDNQKLFFKEDKHLKTFLQGFTEFVTLRFSQDVQDFEKELMDYAQQPHAKRKARIRALKRIISEGTLFDPAWTRKAKGGVKRREWGVKYPRMVNDMGIEGSLFCGFIFDKLKKYLAEYYSHSKCEEQFVKTPDLNVLTTVFQKLVSPEKRMYFPYFSDDSCASIRCSDGVFMANVDISCCDGSNGPAVFEAMRSVVSGVPNIKRFIDGAINQASVKLVITSHGNQQDKLT